MVRTLRTVAVCAALATLTTAQGPAPLLRLPDGPVQRLASPDGSHTLYGVPYQAGRNDAPQLWIENEGTQNRKMLLSLGGTLSAAWSPDSTAFYVNDHRASDSALAYIYDAGTLERMSIAERILASDPGIEPLVEGHAYFLVERWEGAQRVVARLFGHTDESPVVCFDLSYRVSRGGMVEKLSQLIWPVTTKFCEG